MKITDIIWLKKFVSKIESKHRVTTHEIEEVLVNRPRIEFAERGDVAGEDLYRAIGQTDAGRYVVMFFIYKGRGRALVISGRDATRGERKHYGKNKA